MTAAVKKLLEQVRKLPAQERADLVDMLMVDAADNRDPAIERVWLEEIERRIDAYERGEVRGIDGEEILNALERGECP